jgi:hypothetical protein
MPKETAIEIRLCVMDRSHRTLLIRAIRTLGQILFFVSLPFAYGMPKQRLSDAGLRELYRQSEEYAATLLRPNGQADQHEPTGIESDEVETE